MLSRRVFLASAFAAALPNLSFAQLRCPVVQDSFAPQANSNFNAWINRFAGRANRQGIRTETLQTGLHGGGYLPDVVSRDRNQFQTRRTLQDYIALATSDARLARGRQMMGRHANTLNAVAQRFGADPYIVAAIWGVETKFGDRRGSVPVVSATATLAFDGRRGDFYESQLIAALTILQSGAVRPSEFKGSWAGAMGHTQFIPTSYRSFAVDFDQSGHADIWGDDPTDSLASTARYLSRNGWRSGLAWGGEQGVTSARGTVIRPQRGGPGFVTTANYRALLRYNNSASYAISVGVLSDRLRGGGPLRGSFPRDRYGLDLADRKSLQTALSRRYDLGDVDGVIGPKTQCAIVAFEQSAGLPPTGRPSLDLLRRLR
ncbi:MAG: lytic murein transglycosylase [Pseudomonadota bacterium]